jgi:membrane associated rhomboid family serine protease
MIPLKDTIPSRTFPLVNTLLITLNVIAFLMELSVPPHNRPRMVYMLGLIPAEFLQNLDAGEATSLVTSMFLHAGWMHLLSNMLALYIFGDNVEDRMGPARYLVFYLLCGFLASFTHIYFNARSTIPSIGASGAIAGVLGAYLLLYPAARVITLIPIFIFPWLVELPVIFYLGFWFVTQLLSGTLEIVHTVYSPNARDGGGVAYWAHAGGFLAGALLVKLFARPSRRRPKRRLPSREQDRYHY